MASKFYKLYNLIMEELNTSSDYELKDEDVIYRDITLAIVPGSFKPPHKGHWEMVMNYIDKTDKILILISNISTKAISERPLSMANISKLIKIKKFISENNLEDIDEINPF